MSAPQYAGKEHLRFFECGGGRLFAPLRPGLEIEREFADGILELVEVGAKALPSVLHGIEPLVLEHEVAPTTFVEDPAEGIGIEVDRDRR